MKKLVTIISIMLLAGFLSAQEAKVGNVNITRTSIDSTKLKLDDFNFENLTNILGNKSFVLEANTINDKWGNQKFVNNLINFVMVDSTLSTIQVGNDFAIGANGVGGVTVKGKISGWKIKKDEKKKSFLISFTVSTPISLYDAFINVYGDGNASATISGMTSSKITFRGQIVSLDNSKVYVGSHL